MIRKTGKEVLFSPITYFFDSEEDADGFLKCVKGANGRPAACAATWRCVGEERREPVREAVPEPVPDGELRSILHYRTALTD